MSERDLPRGTAFLDELARALGAGARGVVLAEGNWPSFVVAFGDQHLLLARDYPSSVQLSLPNGRHWSVATRRELDAALPAIAVAMHACRTQAPPVLSLADVIAAVIRVARAATNTAWSVGFPSALVPEEATLDDGSGRITISQKGTSFEVRVYVRDGWQTERIAGTEQLGGLGTSIAKALADHARATKKWQEERAAKEAMKKAEGDAMFGDVVEALRRGEQVRRGGGRWSVTYFFEKGLFMCTTFDEGQQDTSAISEDALREAVQADPDDFRSVYGSGAGKKKKKKKKM